MHTMRRWHNPLGNRVTFDLIDIAAEMLAVIALHHGASLSSGRASDGACVG